MIKVLNTFPRRARHRQTFDAGNRRVGVRLTYRLRTQGWYVDLFDTDGTPLVYAKRLTPRWDPFSGLVHRTQLLGTFYGYGTDTGKQQDIGTKLEFWFIPASDLLSMVAAAATPTSEDDFTIEVL